MAARTVNVLSFCSGIGGLDLGLKAAIGDTARTVLFCEGEAYCASVLRARMQDGRLDECPIWSDVKTFDPYPWRGVVDIITAGYPCQPFSSAGKRKGADDPRHLWPYIAAHIHAIRPAVVFCENVPGHLSLGFEQVCEELSSMGYTVEAGLFSAAEIGAPHLRKRLFFVAYTDRADLRHTAHVAGDSAGQNALQPEQHGDAGEVADASLARLQACCSDAIRDSESPKQRPFTRAGGTTDVADSVRAKRRPKCAPRVKVGGAHDGLHANGQQSAGGAADRSADVVDAQHGHVSQRLPESGGENSGGEWIAGPCCAMADANCAGLSVREGVSGNNAKKCETTQRGCDCTRGKDVANPNSLGRKQGRAQSTLQCGGHGADGSCPCGCARDRPAERGLGRVAHASAHRLDHHPWADGWEHGCPRVTTNQPHRIDRLRALGNAVVPGVATLAFTTLVKQALEANHV